MLRCKSLGRISTVDMLDDVADVKWHPRITLRRVSVVALSVLCLALIGWRIARPGWTDRQRFHQQSVRVDVVEGDLLRTKEGTLIRLLGSCANGREDAKAIARAQVESAGGDVMLYLEEVPTRNAAGEVMAYAFVGEALLNQELIAAGVAFADRRFDYAYQQTFERTEEQAAYARRGVWKTFPDIPESAMPAWRWRWLMEQGKKPWERGEWRVEGEP